MSLDDIRAALGLLTVIPVGRRPVGLRPAAWFPWVGWLFGAVALGIAAVAWPHVHSQSGALVVGALIVAGWGGGSRLLHWDGLADTFDGLWGGDTPERRLEIMADSHTGAFGAAAIAFFCVLEVAAVSAVYSSGDWWPLLAAPVVGRFGATSAAWSLPSARPGGLGASVLCRPRPLEIIVGAFGVGLLLVTPDVARVALFVVGVTLAFLIPRVLSRQVGGVTGDLLGASVLLTEAATLAVAALIGG